MSKISEAWRRVPWLFRRGELDRELAEEIRFHLEMETQENIRRGMPPGEAGRAARRAFGNVTLARESAREVWGFPAVESFWQDLRYAARGLRRSPGFAVVAVLSLALVIGANTTVFSFINAVLVQSLPYPDPQRLVVLSEIRGGQPDQRRNPALSTVSEWRRRGESLEEVAVVVSQQPGTISARGQAESGWFLRVSPSLFPVLGVEPQLGRIFTEEEPSYEAGEPIVLSDHYWRDRFEADPQVLGEELVVAGQTNVIVGVLPAGFRCPVLPQSEQIDVWRSVNPSRNKLRETQRLNTLARLKPGFSAEQVRLELDAITRHVEGPDPSGGEWEPEVRLLPEFVFRHWEQPVYLLAAIGSLVLLIGCVNVASLLLARAGTREKEISVRISMGASRGRLVRQLLTESILLAILGGVLGLVLTFWGIGLLIALTPEWWALAQTGIHIDGRVLAFAAAVSLLTGVLFGLVPALRTSRPDLYGSLKEGGRGVTVSNHPLLRNCLIISEVSLTLILLVGAGLMLHSFLNLRYEDPGYDPSHLLTVGVFLQGPEYWDWEGGNRRKIAAQTDRFWDELLERAGRLPGVRAAALNGWAWSGAWLHIVGQSPLPLSERPRVQFKPVSASYFSTLGVPLLRGRGLTDRDLEGSAWVAVMNETMAERFFPDEDPVGRQLQLAFGGWSPDEVEAAEEPHFRTIVGIAGDIRNGLGWEDVPTVYVPYRQHLWEFPTQGAAFSVSAKELMVRATSSPLALKPAVEKVIAGIDRDEAPWYVRSQEQTLANSIGPQRFWMKLFSFFAAVALTLVVVGVFGVIASSVSERVHEMGVRLAIGAQRKDIFLLVMKQGLKVASIGIAIGIAIALGLSRLLSSLMYGVTPTDPFTYSLAALLLLGVGLGASYLPARRATRVDPIVALKLE